MERYTAQIPVEEGILSIVDQGPAIGTQILRGGQRISWIDDGLGMGSQGIHLASNGDAAQRVSVELEIGEGSIASCNAPSEPDQPIEGSASARRSASVGVS